MLKSQLERAESSSCCCAKFRAFYFENSRFRPATDSTDSARVSSTLRTLRKDGDRNARGRKGPPKPSSRKKTPQNPFLLPSQFPLVHACFQSNPTELQALIANRADVNQQVEPPLRERQPPETASTRRTRKDAPRCTPPPIAETPNASKSSYRAVRRREPPTGGIFTCSILGARVNVKDNRWLTPLHRACAQGNEVCRARERGRGHKGIFSLSLSLLRNASPFCSRISPTLARATRIGKRRFTSRRITIT